MANNMEPQNMQDRTDHASDTLRGRTESGFQQAKSMAAEQAETLKNQAGEYASGMVRLARETMEERKSAGADAVSGVARAVSSAADELERESPLIARYVREAASSVENLSGSLRERSMQDMVRGTSDFVRRQPGTVFAGAVLAGLAMSRFAKASAERRGDYDDEGHAYGHRNYRSGYGTRSASANPSGYGSNRRPSGQPGYRDDVNAGPMSGPGTGNVRGTGPVPGAADRPVSPASPRPVGGIE